MARKTNTIKGVDWNSKKTWFTKTGTKKDGDIKKLTDDLKPKSCLNPSKVVQQGVSFMQCKEPKGCKRTAAANPKAYCPKHWAQHQRRLEEEKIRAQEKRARIETEEIVMAAVITQSPDFVDDELTGYKPAWYKAHRLAKEVILEAKAKMKQNRAEIEAKEKAKKSKKKKDKKPKTQNVVTDTPELGAMSFDPEVQRIIDGGKVGRTDVQ